MSRRFSLGAVVLFTTFNAHAIPFTVLDARTMGMGGTGVSSAPLSAIIPYNPALLSAYPYRDEDYISVTPRFGFYLGDEDEVIKNVDDFKPEDKVDELDDLFQEVNDLSTQLTDVIENGANGNLGITDAVTNIRGVVASVNSNDFSTVAAQDITTLQSAAAALDPDTPTSSLAVYIETSNEVNGVAGTNGRLELKLNEFVDFLQDDISNSRIGGGAAGGFAIVVPSKKFAMGISIDANVIGGGTITIEQQDTNLLRDYIAGGTTFVSTSLDVNQDAATLGGSTTNFVAELAALQQATTDGDAAAAAQAETNATTALASMLDCTTTGGTCDVQSSVDAVNNYNFTGSNSGEVIFQNGEVSNTEPELTSTIHLFGAVVTDMALGLSREWNISGRNISIGIAPKLQRVDVFDIIFQIDGEDQNGQELDFDDIEIADYHKEYVAPNLDIGAAYRFGFNERWTTGLSLKNLMGGSYDSAEGKEVTINPMARTGISYYNRDYFLKPKFAVDLDLTSNEPTGFEDGTQFFALGGEIDLFRTIQLRAGYRTNLSSSNKEVVTAGLGLSPAFVHINVAAFANPGNYQKEFGGAFDLGIEF